MSPSFTATGTEDFHLQSSVAEGTQQTPLDREGPGSPSSTLRMQGMRPHNWLPNWEPSDLPREPTSSACPERPLRGNRESFPTLSWFQRQ